MAKFKWHKHRKKNYTKEMKDGLYVHDETSYLWRGNPMEVFCEEIVVPFNGGELNITENDALIYNHITYGQTSSHISLPLAISSGSRVEINGVRIGNGIDPWTLSDIHVMRRGEIFYARIQGSILRDRYNRFETENTRVVRPEAISF